ncbi:hypothetical protein [Aeromicrobium sp. UC242_57]|uniref:hypothetical protein n=1 Tax=Aeromicrobium sp. UC242_57 TaxID=3374624 RepID=UPI00379810EE
MTVVIDFGKLGGKALVRCHPASARGTGLDALKGAGFQVAGVQRWGESFICRIENRPSAVDSAIEGDSGYQEKCIDTPPAAGYWSYWHAGNNCDWTYSQWGVKNRDFVPGGFEGWTFALNSRADDAPKPAIAASRPGTSGQGCTTKVEAGPTTTDLDEKQPDSAAAGGDPAAEDTNSADGDLPAPKPRSTTVTTAPSSEEVPFSGGEDAPDVNETLKEQSRASRYAPWVAGAVLVVLLATMWLTSRRRRAARNA